VDERAADEVVDRHAERERFAEVALKEARDPVAILREQRPIGAELLVEIVDGSLVREGPEDATGDVPG
jgi:hypothetical protein